MASGGRDRIRPAAVLLSLLVLLTHVPAAEAAEPGAPLRVLTFNVHHAAGPDGRVDLDRLAAELAAARPDVVGLQEVDRHYGERSGWADQAAELAARLGMDVVFAAHLDLDPVAPGAPRRQYGTAILSRFPVRSWSVDPLPSAAAAEPRGVLAAVLATPAGPVRVLTTHLGVDGPGARLAQARAVARRVAASPEPVLLLGDLNAAPDAPEVATLTALLADAGQACGPTFPAPVPAERIDYVLGEGRVVDCAVLPTLASDHRPLLVTVVVDRAPGTVRTAPAQVPSAEGAVAGVVAEVSAGVGVRRAQSGACSGCGPIAKP